MEIILKDNKKALIRPYKEKDFNKIQDLNKDEGWTNLVVTWIQRKRENSNVALSC